MRQVRFPDVYTTWPKLKDVRPNDSLAIIEYVTAINNENPVAAGEALKKLENKVMQTADWQERFDVVEEMYAYVDEKVTAGGGTWQFTSHSVSATEPNNASIGTIWADIGIIPIPCTSITFDHTTLSLQTGYTEEATITATTLPGGEEPTTDHIVWSCDSDKVNISYSDNVCRVSIKGKTISSQTIVNVKATCGTKQATCVVTIGTLSKYNLYIWIDSNSAERPAIADNPACLRKSYTTYVDQPVYKWFFSKDLGRTCPATPTVSLKAGLPIVFSTGQDKEFTVNYKGTVYNPLNWKYSTRYFIFPENLHENLYIKLTPDSSNPNNGVLTVTNTRPTETGGDGEWQVMET